MHLVQSDAQPVGLEAPSEVAEIQALFRRSHQAQNQSLASAADLFAGLVRASASLGLDDRLTNHVIGAAHKHVGHQLRARVRGTDLHREVRKIGRQASIEIRGFGCPVDPEQL